MIKYLNSAALAEIPGFSNDIQVIDFGGNSELARKLAILKNMENFDGITSLLIIRDAETNAQSACLEIQHALKQNNLPVPQEPHCWVGEIPKVGFVLFPTCDNIAQDGTLEDLCLSILSDSNAEETLEEIGLFLTQLEKRRQKPFRGYSRPNYIHFFRSMIIMCHLRLVKRLRRAHLTGMIRSWNLLRILCKKSYEAATR